MKIDNITITEAIGKKLFKSLVDTISLSENISTPIINHQLKVLSDSIEIEDTLDSVYKIVREGDQAFIRSHVY